MIYFSDHLAALLLVFELEKNFNLKLRIKLPRFDSIGSIMSPSDLCAGLSLLPVGGLWVGLSAVKSGRLFPCFGLSAM